MPINQARFDQGMTDELERPGVPPPRTAQRPAISATAATPAAATPVARPATPTRPTRPAVPAATPRPPARPTVPAVVRAADPNTELSRITARSEQMWAEPLPRSSLPVSQFGSGSRASSLLGTPSMGTPHPASDQLGYTTPGTTSSGTAAEDDSFLSHAIRILTGSKPTTR